MRRTRARLEASSRRLWGADVLKRPFLIAIVLGILTSLVVGLAEGYLPYSEAKTWVIDALTVPGALIAGIAYPQGIHSGSGAALWPFVVVAANLGVYIAFWFLCLRVLHRLRLNHEATN